ncbi:MAG: Gfo/Idh/MocA family oxidoreductase, partial [Pseudomonadota bacterium]
MTVNVAILGAGIGREHLRGYRALADRYTVATLCDLDKERAHTVLSKEAPDGGTAVTVDADACLADPSIDLIDVCLPPHLHAPVAIKALAAGKHVVCEKPLATSPAEADAMLGAARAAGRELFPVFQYRYGPAMAQLQALMDAGLAGKAFAASMETHWDRQADYYAIPWRGTWAGENGGAVLGHAIHNHDLLTTILGPIASLSAHTA